MMKSAFDFDAQYTLFVPYKSLFLYEMSVNISYS